LPKQNQSDSFYTSGTRQRYLATAKRNDSKDYFDATQNYWGGLTGSDVKKMISDKTTNIRIPYEFRITPLLNEPHPDTPDCSQGS
tara:strand:+ start:4298 stop:4552 length:255 start_codon:yes stop_codon:yes gene_type:complete